MDKGLHPREGLQAMNLQGSWTIFSESLSDSSIQSLSLQDNLERDVRTGSKKRGNDKF
jgi:hypothetical protein